MGGSLHPWGRKVARTGNKKPFLSLGPRGGALPMAKPVQGNPCLSCRAPCPVSLSKQLLGAHPSSVESRQLLTSSCLSTFGICPFLSDFKPCSLSKSRAYSLVPPGNACLTLCRAFPVVVTENPRPLILQPVSGMRTRHPILSLQLALSSLIPASQPAEPHQPLSPIVTDKAQGFVSQP